MPRMPVTDLNKQIASLAAKLNKSPNVKGASVIADIDMAPNTYFLRRPSGIMSLDVHTGGGLPAGGLTYLSGPDGVGKTYLLYRYIAMNQKLLGDKSATALGVSETAPDHFFMRRCGVQVRIPEQMIEERVHERKERGYPPPNKEELAWWRMKTVGQLKILRGSTGEELLNTIIDCFESKLFDLVGLDSVSALLPEADAAKELDEESKRAGSALMLTKFFQHYLNGTTGYNGNNPTTVIFTSQVRSNSKKSEAPGHIQKYIIEYMPQGAWAAKHGKLIDILLKPGEKEKEKVGASTTTMPTTFEQARAKTVQTGKAIRYEVLKGKAGVHEGITGEYDFHYDRLVDGERSIVMSGLSLGIVAEKDGLVTFFNPATKVPYPEASDLTVDELVNKMREDFDLELRLRRAVLSASGIDCAYR